MGPLLYKPMPKWQIFAALGGAIAIHVTAAVIAGLKPEEQVADLSQIPEAVAEVTFEQAQPEPTPPPEVEEPEPTEMPPEPTEVPEFIEEKPTPKPKTDKPKPIAPIARPAPQGLPKAGPMSMSSAKAVAVSAPRPEYPYEARRSKLTGSGVCVMTVDVSSGAVTSADMSTSTGSPILDNAATSAFRRWRFKPGTVSKVRTPITFTMTGAQF
jgi:protein TonB